MRDFKDLNEEGEEGAEPKKKMPSRTMIGLLGLLVFVLLFFFFSRNQTPVEPTLPEVSQIPPQPAAPDSSTVPAAPAPGGETVLKDSELKPGEIRFDSKKEEAVSSGTPGPSKTEPALTAQSPGDAAPKDDLTFFKTLKDKSSENVALSPKKEGSKAAPSIKKEGKPKKEFKVAKAKIPPVRDFSAPALQSSGRYTIQVASFAEKEGADELAQKLKKKGYPSYVTVGDVPQKGRWYRVRIGHYPDRTEAQRAADRIQKAEKLNFFISSDGG